MVGLSRFELLTPRLSSVCSNQLSYRPVSLKLAPLAFAARGHLPKIPYLYTLSFKEPATLQ